MRRVLTGAARPVYARRGMTKRAGSDPDSDTLTDATVVARKVRVVDEVAKPEHHLVLEQVRGPGAPRRFPLEAAETIVGRGKRANVSIDSNLLSRRHMSLVRSGPEITCRDLDSANGVYVNGVKVNSATLFEGDTLQIGDVVFVLRETD
jgi:pSer/pThr/pTyr-binding forkhead associated (FHA) protein